MTTDMYLKLISKLNKLITHKEEEKEQLFVLATKTTQVNDDMPHASGTSDKVGNISVKIIEKEIEIDELIDLFIDLKAEIIEQIQKLDDDEYDVLFRYYVSGEGLFDIAEDREQSVDWIKKLKWRGLNNVQIHETVTYSKVISLIF